MYIQLEQAINGYIVRLVTKNGIFSFVYKSARTTEKCISWLQSIGAKVIRSSSDTYLRILLGIM